MRKQYYFRPSSRGLLAWDVDRLVAQSRHLLRRHVLLSDLLEHIKLIEEADLSFPIILSADGRVMDGRHRIAKAALQGHPTVEAVQFVEDPVPDHVGRGPDELPYWRSRPMMVTYRSITREDYDQVRQLLVDMGWQHRVADRDRFERMIEGATRTIVAVENSRIVGFARALVDGASNGYISTVAVAPDRQRGGIGRAMVQRLMEVDEPGAITWVLRAGRGAAPFWEKMGFSKSETAMEIVRKS